MKYFTIIYKIFDLDLWCSYEDKKSFIAKDKPDAVKQLKKELNGKILTILEIKEELQCY